MRDPELDSLLNPLREPQRESARADRWAAATLEAARRTPMRLVPRGAFQWAALAATLALGIAIGRLAPRARDADVAAFEPSATEEIVIAKAE